MLSYLRVYKGGYTRVYTSGCIRESIPGYIPQGCIREACWAMYTGVYKGGMLGMYTRVYREEECGT